MEIVEFLEARIAEDEVVAKRAAGRTDWVEIDDNHVSTVHGIHIATSHGLATSHIARHDPARVLAECQAKRAIVELHAECGTGYGFCDDAGQTCAHGKTLAAIYSRHPRLPRGVAPVTDTPRRTIRVEDWLWGKAQAKAAERGETLTAVIRRALLRYVGKG